MEVGDRAFEVAEGEGLVRAAGDTSLDREHEGEVLGAAGIVDEGCVPLCRLRVFGSLG